MDRRGFLSIFGKGSLGVAAAMSGLSEAFIVENLKQDSQYFYVELPHIPGTRFVFGNKSKVDYDGLMIGSIKPDLEQIKHLYGKGLYTKDSLGNFIPYEQVIDPLITNSQIKELKMQS